MYRQGERIHFSVPRWYDRSLMRLVRGGLLLLRRLATPADYQQLLCGICSSLKAWDRNLNLYIMSTIQFVLYIKLRNGMWSHRHKFGPQGRSFWYRLQSYSCKFSSSRVGNKDVRRIMSCKVHSSVIRHSKDWTVLQNGWIKFRTLIWMIFIKLPNPSGRTRPWGLLIL
jgi:hypothetical protein